MNYFIGYAFIFLYVFILIFVVGLVTKKVFNIEISRKVIHICLFVLWILIDIFFKNTIHQIIIPFVFILINALSYKFNIFKSIERTNKNHPGTIYFAIAVTIVYTISYFIPELYKFTYYAVMALTIGDGTASLFGHIIKSPKIYKNKSLSGFIACGIFTFLSFLINYFLIDSSISIFTLFVLAILTAILELVDFGLDNFTITLFIFSFSYFCYELGDAFVNSLAFGTIVFLLVFFTNLITYYGSIISLIIVFCFSFCGGINALIYLISCYIISVICALIKKVKKINKNIEKKSGKKDAIQILANGIFPTVVIIIYCLTKNDILFIVSLIGIGSNLVDSVSSDIGCLSSKKPYDFLKRKYVQTGLSGGVTLLGSSVSFAVSLFCSFVIFLMYKGQYYFIPIFTLFIFSGTIIDSLLGSAIQNKNICLVCSEITEKEFHCDTKCEHYSGIRFVDNDVVNLLSSLINVSLSLILLVVI